MVLLKVIVFVMIILISVVDSRTRRLRRQVSQHSAYTGTYGSGYNTLNGGQPSYGLRVDGYPVGNNWYVSNNQGYSNNNQFPYNLQQQQQQYPQQQQQQYPSNGGYTSWTGHFNTGQSGQPYNSQFSADQPYTGQSYVPTNSEWLPLPGVDRRKRSFRTDLIGKMTSNHAISKNQ